jgi:hypothetical protein
MAKRVMHRLAKVLRAGSKRSFAILKTVSGVERGPWPWEILSDFSGHWQASLRSVRILHT